MLGQGNSRSNPECVESLKKRYRTAFDVDMVPDSMGKDLPAPRANLCTVSGLALARLLLLLIAAASLSGCVTMADPGASQSYDSDTVGSVDVSHSVGQTFISRRPRLAGIELWLSHLSPLNDSPGSMLLAELYHEPREQRPIAVTRLPLAEIAGDNPIRLAFTPQYGAAGQQYYLNLTAHQATVSIQGRNEDVYPDGQAFVDGVPVHADLAFRLLYDYDARAAISDLVRALPHAWLAFPLIALLLLPGWLLFDLVGLGQHFEGGEKAALAVGLSLAIVPMLLLWTTVAGVNWNRLAVVGAVAFLSGVAGWRSLRGLMGKSGVGRPILSTLWRELKSRWWGLEMWTLIGILLLSLAVRLIMVRDLAGPAWVDSVHHALISQLIVDTGALPTTYTPLVAVDMATYHPGFHSVVAAFHWLSGLDIPGALLLTGQVLNALMVIATYLLAKEMTGDGIAGLVAALVVGLFSPMPAYYASWGRYTQLAGLLILPAALVLARRLLIPEHVTRQTMGGRLHNVRLLALAAIALGGLVLTHYRVTAFYGGFLLAFLVVGRSDPGSYWQKLKGSSLRLGLLTITAATLTLPWLLPTWTALWLPKLFAWSGGEPSAYIDFSWDHLLPGQGKYVVALALTGLGLALVRRQRFAITLMVWVVLLLLLASLGPLGLPGGGFVNFVSIEIMLFLPMAVLGGYLVSQFLTAWREILLPRQEAMYRGTISAIAIAVALLGAWTLPSILNADNVLLREADRQAMAWIQENTPEDARFLVNPLYWSNHLYTGNDGGYWIGPLAGRQTIPPPLLYGLGSEAEIAAINDACASVIARAEDAEALWILLQDLGVSHVFIGARGGVLSVQVLEDSDRYHSLYAQDGVWVFQVLHKDLGTMLSAPQRHRRTLQ